MGAPIEDADLLADWSHWMQSQFDAQSLLADRDRIERAVTEFTDWCDALVALRRGDPADDLVSVLIAAEPDGGRLTDVELRNLVLDVLAGGIDTTQAQLAHAVRLFAEHPDQWALLAERPELLPAAVDEVLRHEPVTPFTARILTADVEYRDLRFARGTVVLVSSFTGNRDGLDDTAFDITADRDGARVMTFGAGIHFCVGANLARAELEEALGHLAPRMPGLHLAGPADYGTTQGIYALGSLPIGWKTG
jgi:cytochrome P450